MFKRFYLDLNLGMNLSSLHDRKVYLQITGEKFETKIITEDTAKNCTNTIAKTVLNHNPAALSHFCDVPSNIISKRNVTEIQIVGEPEEGANGLPPLYGMHSYIPEQVRRNLVKRGYKRMRKTGTSVHELATQTHPKLKAYFDIGIIPKAVSLENVATHVVETDLLISPYDTAVSLLSKHPELASSKAYTAGVAQEHIVGIDDPQQQQRVLDLATSISKQGPATKTGGWAVIRQAVETDADGQEQPMFADYTLKDDQGASFSPKVKQ
ncbi:hypothetical protein [Pseudovibrio denitrificans]|uniref:hypothetical protein n=1 Tax=Pseudovibrio denitrificans TaxID=258256 RepID=UPI0006D084B1|nr:hypothetical protein [Pseudovibrio denitrificans]